MLLLLLKDGTFQNNILSWFCFFCFVLFALVKLQHVCICMNICCLYLSMNATNIWQIFLFRKSILCKSRLNTASLTAFALLGASYFSVLCTSHFFCRSSHESQLKKTSTQSRKVPNAIWDLLHCPISWNKRSDNWQQIAKLSLAHPKITDYHPGPAGVPPWSLSDDVIYPCGSPSLRFLFSSVFEYSFSTSEPKAPPSPLHSLCRFFDKWWMFHKCINMFN